MKCRRLLEYLDTSLSDFKQDVKGRIGSKIATFNILSKELNNILYDLDHYIYVADSAFQSFVKCLEDGKGTSYNYSGKLVDLEKFQATFDKFADSSDKNISVKQGHSKNSLNIKFYANVDKDRIEIAHINLYASDGEVDLGEMLATKTLTEMKIYIGVKENINFDTIVDDHIKDQLEEILQ